MTPHIQLNIIYSTLILILVSGIGCGSNSNPTQPPTTTHLTSPENTSNNLETNKISIPNSPQNPSENIEIEKADMVVSAEDFYKEFSTDFDAFSSKYKNKLVEIFGPVRFYDYSFGADTCYIFIGPGTNKFICKDLHPMEKAMPGQTVYLQSRDFGYWNIVRVEGDPPPTISADQFLKDYKADPEGTAQKYRKGYLVLSGTIDRVDTTNGSSLYLAPQGSDPRLRCDFTPVDDRQGLFKAGQKVRVLGRWEYGAPDLSDCFVLPPTN